MAQLLKEMFDALPEFLSDEFDFSTSRCCAAPASIPIVAEARFSIAGTKVVTLALLGQAASRPNRVRTRKDLRVNQILLASAGFAGANAATSVPEHGVTVLSLMGVAALLTLRRRV